MLKIIILDKMYVFLLKLVHFSGFIDKYKVQKYSIYLN